ncbi:pyrimidine-specific ribonucleoside hydrolase RihA [Oceanivirga salmonicida]|uniref:pyrimidine-specific ribonucleoside hydrolase RihA n=1 Tax=Oceanivirga salmonicida TaxID=1769291 RepID=UPI00082C1C66|nr:pyrimidine-specific ribonucleoside hydrolase RihA [Oceanivirga salmonicida]
MSKIPVILDCDPGHDDAIAIILACASDKLDVKAITTVGGNQTISKTTNNALRILTFINRDDIPVAKGADKPMRRTLEIAPEVHGDSGLDGPELPEPNKIELDINAYELMAKVIEESKDKVTLVPTGPLTNIAIFLISYPHLHSKIEKISLMGGSAIGGNWTASAEFNILVDPEASDIVFKSGIPIVMSGLDVTHKAQIREKEIAKIKAQGGKVAILVGELLEFFMKFHKEIVGFDFAPLHDPCAVAYLMKPEMFKSKKLNVCIDMDGEHTVGCTVTDFNGVTGKKPNVDVLVDVDINSYVDLIIDSVNKYE